MNDSGSSAHCPWLHENPATSATILLGLVDNELTRLQAGTDIEQHAAALSFDYYNLVRHLLMDPCRLFTASLSAPSHAVPRFSGSKGNPLLVQLTAR